MKNYNYKCIVAKNGNKMYYKRVSSKWKRVSNAVGMKAEKGKRKYGMYSGESSPASDEMDVGDAESPPRDENQPVGSGGGAGRVLSASERRKQEREAEEARKLEAKRQKALKARGGGESSGLAPVREPERREARARVISGPALDSLVKSTTTSRARAAASRADRERREGGEGEGGGKGSDYIESLRTAHIDAQSDAAKEKEELIEYLTSLEGEKTGSIGNIIHLDNLRKLPQKDIQKIIDIIVVIRSIPQLQIGEEPWLTDDDILWQFMDANNRNEPYLNVIRTFYDKVYLEERRRWARNIIHLSGGWYQKTSDSKPGTGDGSPIIVPDMINHMSIEQINDTFQIPDDSVAMKGDSSSEGGSDSGGEGSAGGGEGSAGGGGVGGSSIRPGPGPGGSKGKGHAFNKSQKRKSKGKQKSKAKRKTKSRK